MFYQVKEINASSSLGQTFFFLLLIRAYVRVCVRVYVCVRACVSFSFFIFYFFIMACILFRNLLTFRYI